MYIKHLYVSVLNVYMYLRTMQIVSAFEFAYYAKYTKVLLSEGA